MFDDDRMPMRDAPLDATFVAPLSPEFVALVRARAACGYYDQPHVIDALARRLIREDVIRTH